MPKKKFPSAKSINYSINDLYPKRSIEQPYLKYLKRYVQGERLVLPAEKINDVGPSGEALIHIAAKNGDFALLKLLLDHGAYINNKTEYDKSSGKESVTALSLVLKEIEITQNDIVKDKLKLVQDILLDYGADRAAIGDDKREKAQGKKKSASKQNKENNEKIVKDCADGDEQLEKIYMDFYQALQARMSSVLGGLKSADSNFLEIKKETPKESKVVRSVTNVISLLPYGDKVNSVAQFVLDKYDELYNEKQSKHPGNPVAYVVSSNFRFQGNRSSSLL